MMIWPSDRVFYKIIYITMLNMYEDTHISHSEVQIYIYPTNDTTKIMTSQLRRDSYLYSEISKALRDPPCSQLYHSQEFSINRQSMLRLESVWEGLLSLRPCFVVRDFLELINLFFFSRI